jgi:hypothetical protein
MMEKVQKPSTSVSDLRCFQILFQSLVIIFYIPQINSVHICFYYPIIKDLFTYIFYITASCLFSVIQGSRLTTAQTYIMEPCSRDTCIQTTMLQGHTSCYINTSVPTLTYIHLPLSQLFLQKHTVIDLIKILPGNRSVNTSKCARV